MGELRVSKSLVDGMLEAFGQAAARQAAEDLAGYARLGGLMLQASGSSWARSPIVTRWRTHAPPPRQCTS